MKIIMLSLSMFAANAMLYAMDRDIDKHELTVIFDGIKVQDCKLHADIKNLCTAFYAQQQKEITALYHSLSQQYDILSKEQLTVDSALQSSQHIDKHSRKLADIMRTRRVDSQDYDFDIGTCIKYTTVIHQKLRVNHAFLSSQELKEVNRPLNVLVEKLAAALLNLLAGHTILKALPADGRKKQICHPSGNLFITVMDFDSNGSRRNTT